MKRLLTVLLLAGLLLCGSACGQREPNQIDRDLLTATGSGTGASDAEPDHTQLPVYHPLRIERASKWDGEFQTLAANRGQPFSFSSGSGTEADPYLLTDVQDLMCFAANVAEMPETGDPERVRYAGVYFRLECDIDLQGLPWLGIGFGGSGNPGDSILFAGNFDGNGHAIYNFAPLNRPMNGFFSVIGHGAVIRNLCIASGSARVRSGEAMGLLAAEARSGAVIENCTIRMGLAVASSVKEVLVGAIGSGADGAVAFRSCDFSGTELNGEAYDLPELAKMN